MFPRVAIIYLSFNSEPYWTNVIDALKKSTYPKDQIEFIIVDNPHPVHGSSKKYIEEKIVLLSGKELPRITFLPQEKNLGFAGGNNVGIKKALELGCEYVYLHNQDGFVEPGTIQKLVEVMESDKTIGAVQSLVMLYPEINLINTTGNAFHYLGFGYADGFRKKLTDTTLTNISEIGYASGASALYRADLLKKYGALDEDLFLYHEDLEYSLRLKSMGYRIVVVPESLFYHQYSFSRNQAKYYFMERNRLAVVFMYYKFLTIILLLPIVLVVELGLILVSLVQGWWPEKFRAYGYWLRPSSWSLWFVKRVHWQHTRTVSDKQLLTNAVSTIKFDDTAIDNFFLRYLANPAMSTYWFLVKKVIFW